MSQTNALGVYEGVFRVDLDVRGKGGAMLVDVHAMLDEMMNEGGTCDVLIIECVTNDLCHE